MKVNFSQTIKNADGSEIGIDLAKVAVSALNVSEPGHILSLDESTRRGLLAIKIANGGEQEITPEEATLIRSQLPKSWTPIVVARAAEMLKG